MKWTQSFNLVKFLLLAVLAAGLSASLANAEEFKFTLPFAARWGRAVLPAGEYSFNLDPRHPPFIAEVRQGQQYVALITTTTPPEESEVAGSNALIAVPSGGIYRIRELRLAKDGIVLKYMAPKGERQMVAQAPQLIRSVPVSMMGK